MLEWKKDNVPLKIDKIHYSMGIQSADNKSIASSLFLENIKEKKPKRAKRSSSTQRSCAFSVDMKGELFIVSVRRKLVKE